MSLRRLGVLVVAVVGLVVEVPPAFGTETSGENGRIAFASDRRTDQDLDIWSMRPNGSNAVNLTADSTADEFGPTWRPDGRKLAFMSNQVTATNPEGDFEIFLMNANGRGVRQLTANTFDDEFPSWSSDGRNLVFQRDFDPVIGQVDYDLFTMKAGWHPPAQSHPLARCQRSGCGLVTHRPQDRLRERARRGPGGLHDANRRQPAGQSDSTPGGRHPA